MKTIISLGLMGLTSTFVFAGPIANFSSAYDVRASTFLGGEDHKSSTSTVSSSVSAHSSYSDGMGFFASANAIASWTVSDGAVSGSVIDDGTFGSSSSLLDASFDLTTSSNVDASIGMGSLDKFDGTWSVLTTSSFKGVLAPGKYRLHLSGKVQDQGAYNDSSRLTAVAVPEASGSASLLLGIIALVVRPRKSMSTPK